MEGREKVTDGLFPLEFVRFMCWNDTAVVDVDALGRNGMPWLSLTVLTDPVDTFFLAKLLSDSDVGCGRPGSGLGTISCGKAEDQTVDRTHERQGKKDPWRSPQHLTGVNPLALSE